MMMNRRNFSTALLGVTAASLISSPGMAANVGPIGARNIVFVHGLFADGSCWSEVIARLQPRGLNCTSVQNPLTTLPEAVASAQMVLDQQDGPTVFVGHSFSGMILTEAGVHPKVSAVVYVAARATRCWRGLQRSCREVSHAACNRWHRLRWRPRAPY